MTTDALKNAVDKAIIGIRAVSNERMLSMTYVAGFSRGWSQHAHYGPEDRAQFTDALFAAVVLRRKKVA